MASLYWTSKAAGIVLDMPRRKTRLMRTSDWSAISRQRLCVCTAQSCWSHVFSVPCPWIHVSSYVPRCAALWRMSLQALALSSCTPCTMIAMTVVKVVFTMLWHGAPSKMGTGCSPSRTQCAADTQEMKIPRYDAFYYIQWAVLSPMRVPYLRTLYVFVAPSLLKLVAERRWPRCSSVILWAKYAGNIS